MGVVPFMRRRCAYRRAQQTTITVDTTTMYGWIASSNYARNNDLDENYFRENIIIV